MKRMKTLLPTRWALLAGALLICGASLTQAAPAPVVTAPTASRPAEPAPAAEVIRVAWDRVGAEA
jgi:hypothetical protein